MNISAAQPSKMTHFYKNSCFAYSEVPNKRRRSEGKSHDKQNITQNNTICNTKYYKKTGRGSNFGKYLKFIIIV